MSAPILVIRLITSSNIYKIATIDDPVEWMWFQDGLPVGAANKARIGDLSAVLRERDTMGNARTVLLLPAEEVVLTRIKIPVNQKRQKEKLVPFILEEHLNDTIADVFFATEWLPKSEDVGVAYISKDRMQQWLKLFEEQHIKLDVVYPEHYLLPSQDGQCFAVFDRHRVMVRHDHWIASTAPLDFSEFWLSRVIHDLLQEENPSHSLHKCSLLIDKNDTSALEVSAECEARLKSLVTDLHTDSEEEVEPEAKPSVELSVKRLLVTQSVTYILALEAVRKITEHQTFQMLQQDFKSSRRKRKSKYQWQKAAALVGVLALVELGYTASSYYAYDNAYTKARQENIALFKSAFPHVTRVRGSLKRALSSELAKSGTGQSDTEFLKLVSLTGESMRGAKGLVIQRMAFDAGQNSLKVDLEVSDYPDLEGIQKKIEAESLKVKIDGANKEDNKVKARLRIDVS